MTNVLRRSTVTATSTETRAKAMGTYIPCTGPFTSPGSNPGTGGCSSNCYCDSIAGSNGQGFCEQASYCGGSCNTSADCPSGSLCADNYQVECGGNTCIPYDGCSASGTPKKMAVRGDDLWRVFELSKMSVRREVGAPLHRPPPKTG